MIPHAPAANPGSRVAYAMTVLLAALAGCAQQPAVAPAAVSAQAAVEQDKGNASPAKAPGQAAEEPRTQLPAQELTETLLYEFLLAEIAGQRGNIGLAAQAYADLAKRTRDPRIARRATEIAIYARMNNTAVEAARIWHQTDPRSQRALQVLAGLLVNTNRLDEALPYMQKLLSAEGANAAEGFMQLGRTLGNVQDKSAILRLVQQLAQSYAKLPQAYYAVAQAASNAGQDELALGEVRKAQALRPDWEPAVLFEAQLLQRASNSEALARLAAHLEKFPNSRDVRLGYARALVAEKRFPQARAEFEKLVADFPANSEVIYAVALLSLQMNDYEGADANLRRLLELDYRDKNSVRLQLGQIAEEQQKYSDALRWYTQVGEGEQFIPAQIRFAQVLSKQGRLGEARSHLRRVGDSNTEHQAQLILAEAHLLREANQEKEAFQLVGEALETQPEHPDLLYDHAMLAEKIDRIDILESSLRKLIAIRPDHAHAYNALGYTLADRNQRLAEARQLIETALKLAPQDFFIIDSMGWVLYRMGNLPEALVYLRKAFAGRPDPEIAAHLGEVLWVLGERSEAEKLWREFVEKNPKNETLLNTIKRFKK